MIPVLSLCLPLYETLGLLHNCPPPKQNKTEGQQFRKGKNLVQYGSSKSGKNGIFSMYPSVSLQDAFIFKTCQGERVA